MAPQIDAKSMKNRGCVFRAFLGGPGAPKGGGASSKSGPLSATILDQKSKKGIQKGM